jgi:hypothetical protein
MRQGEAPAGLLDRIGGDASNKQLLIWRGPIGELMGCVKPRLLS